MPQELTQNLALDVLALSLERAPRAMVVLDRHWQVRVANRLARDLPGLSLGTTFPALVQTPPEQTVHGLKQALTTSRNVPLRLSIGEDELTFQAWRIDPLPGLDEPLVMLKADPSNYFAARLNSLERAQEQTRQRLSQTERERDRLRKDARRLSALAMTDQLTGLLNARSFREAGYRLLSDPATSVGVLFMDLNGFKPVNDRFGHHAGDHLLRTIARRMSDSLRHQDICARLGGDEFAVWLPGATTDTLERRKHHLRAQLSRPIWWQVDGGPSILLPRVEAAIGAASAPVDGSDVETLLACADQRMYADKPAPDAATRRSG